LLKKKRYRYLDWGTLYHSIVRFFFLVLILLPIGVLIVGAILDLFSGHIHVFNNLIGVGARSWVMIVRSVGLSASIAFACMLIGTFLAIALQYHKHHWLFKLRYGVFLLMLLPPYLHTLTWDITLLAIEYHLTPAGVLEFIQNPYLKTWWVHLMSFLPIGIGMALLGVESVSSISLEAGRLSRSESGVIRHLLVPLAAPAILAGGGFVFVLSILDYSIAGYFGLNTYALEILAEHSTSGNPSSTLITSFPIILVALFIILKSQKQFRSIAMTPKSGYRSDWEKRDIPKGLKVLSLFCGGILLVCMVVPVVTLFLTTGRMLHFVEGIKLAIDELSYSIPLSFVSAVIGTLICYTLAKTLHTSLRTNHLWWVAVLLPIALPSTLIGVGLIQTWNHPWSHWMYDSSFVTMISSVFRVVPFGVLLMYAQQRKLDDSMLEAAKVYQRNWIHRFLRVKWPVVKGDLLVCFLLCFSLSITELGATILTVPAGKSTLTMRIYTLMHYGATEMVTGLGLMMLLIPLLTGVLILLFIKQQQKA
jgi:iron(III) transport system permease protein